MKKTAKKKTIRNNIIRLRDKMPALERKEKSKMLTQNIVALDEFGRANTVMFFATWRSEPDTLPIIKKSLLMQKNVVLPKVEKGRGKNKLLPIRIESPENDLREGVWGIREPYKRENIVPDRKIDLVFVPAVAFDGAGNRIGYGGGFYDGFLKNIPLSKRIGVGFEFQVLRKIPFGNKDVRVKKIITEKGVKTCFRTPHS
ncbi:MAG: 5-formyltetrahydrofolate cyclo-ligase [Elusimicrobia bacterium]|nr:5-formyltetrahydrofolate cyclo-ligase [Elusimicrobiota bacterium]